MSAGRLTGIGQNYVGGRWMPSESGDTFTRRCPLDHCTLGPYADAGDAGIDMAVASATAAAPAWGSLAAAERAAVLHRIAAVIERHASELADTMTHEEGKRLSESLGETTYAVSL